MDEQGESPSVVSAETPRLQLSLLNQACDEPGRVGAWPARKGENPLQRATTIINIRRSHVPGGC